MTVPNKYMAATHSMYDLTSPQLLNIYHCATSNTSSDKVSSGITGLNGRK